MSDNINMSSWLMEDINPSEVATPSTTSIEPRGYGEIVGSGCDDDNGNYSDSYSNYSDYSNYYDYSVYSVYGDYYNYSDYYNYYNYYNYSNTVSVATHPSNANRKAGTSVTFTATFSGTVDSYQWYVATSSTAAGTAISGATAASYTISSVAVTDNDKYYYCVAKRSSNTATTNRALLQVLGTPTATISESGSHLVGSTVTYSVAATKSGAGTLSYQWYKDGISISGATSSSYAAPVEDKLETTGYKCVVTQTLGTLTSTKEVSASLLVWRLMSTDLYIPFGADLCELVGEYVKPFFYSTNNSTISNVAITNSAIVEYNSNGFKAKQVGATTATLTAADGSTTVINIIAGVDIAQYVLLNWANVLRSGFKKKSLSYAGSVLAATKLLNATAALINSTTISSNADISAVEGQTLIELFSATATLLRNNNISTSGIPINYYRELALNVLNYSEV